MDHYRSLVQGLGTPGLEHRGRKTGMWQMSRDTILGGSGEPDGTGLGNLCTRVSRPALLRKACWQEWLLAGVWVSRVSHTSLTDKGGAVWALCTDSVFMLNTARQRGFAWPGPSKHLWLWVAFLGNHMAHMLLHLVAEGECALCDPRRRERAWGSSHTDSSRLHPCPFPLWSGCVSLLHHYSKSCSEHNYIRVLNPSSEFSNMGVQNPREENKAEGTCSSSARGCRTRTEKRSLFFFL